MSCISNVADVSHFIAKVYEVTVDDIKSDVRTRMKETRFNLLKSSGSYFIGASFESISTERDFEFAVRLTKEYGIATIPLSSFYVDGKDDKVLRFCFGKKKSTLEAAVEKLRKI